MSSIAAAVVVDLARMRHPALSQHAAPDGVLVQQINARQRTLVLMYGGAVDGLVNTTVSLATPFSGVLLGNSGGVPYYLTTYADGWPVGIDSHGVPFVDFTQPPIAGDPFGQHGGVPGFPLPTDFLKLILCSAVLNDNTQVPVDIVPEVARLERQRNGRLTAFVSGNRLVPVRPLAAGNANDIWSLPITSIQMSYVAMPVVQALTDLITLPAALLEALTAGMTEFMAFNAPSVTSAEKSAFSVDARRAEQTVSDFSLDIIGAASPHAVTYRR